MCDLKNELDLFGTLTKFISIEKIGEGTFSSVFKVRRVADGKIYALKKIRILPMKEKDRNNALNQIRILASLDSPFIIKYKEAFFDKQHDLLCVVMEWANEGDLFKKIQAQKKSHIHFPEKQIWKAILYVTQGIAVLHSKSILHRDIKTTNIFVSNGVYKLGNLNISKVQDSDQLAYSQTGTPYYASPEVWRDEPYDSRSDIWSLGCIIYEMCTLKTPFQGKDLESLYKSIQKGMYEPISFEYSDDLDQIIAICLNRNPQNRMSAEELLNSSRSPLVKKCQQYKLERSGRGCDLPFLSAMTFTVGEDIQKQLPSPRYQAELKKANSTIETPERTKSKYKMQAQANSAKVKNKMRLGEASTKPSLTPINLKENEEKVTSKNKKNAQMERFSSQACFDHERVSPKHNMNQLAKVTSCIAFAKQTVSDRLSSRPGTVQEIKKQSIHKSKGKKQIIGKNAGYASHNYLPEYSGNVDTKTSKIHQKFPSSASEISEYKTTTMGKKLKFKSDKTITSNAYVKSLNIIQQLGTPRVKKLLEVPEKVIHLTNPKKSIIKN